jgi:hypothetical protein
MYNNSGKKERKKERKTEKEKLRKLQKYDSIIPDYLPVIFLTYLILPPSVTLAIFSSSKITNTRCAF